MEAEHPQSGHWLSAAGTGPAMLGATGAGDPTDMGSAGHHSADLFFHTAAAMDSNANHDLYDIRNSKYDMHAASYYNPAARAMHPYRSSHGK